MILLPSNCLLSAWYAVRARGATSSAQAGYDYDDETFERIFRRIYSTFGSAAPYSAFPDAQRFLRWLRKEGLVVGIVSNAEHRYRDVVLPALGINQVSRPLHPVQPAVHARRRRRRRIASSHPPTSSGYE